MFSFNLGLGKLSHMNTNQRGWTWQLGSWTCGSKGWKNLHLLCND